jgi:hypothetical protein
MKLPGHTTYDDWDQLRRIRFTVVDGMPDVTVQHNRYETCLFLFDSGNSGIATWEPSTGSCYIKTKREAIFTVLQTMRNYMMNALGAWEFKDGKNIDSDDVWGVMFTNEEEAK